MEVMKRPGRPTNEEKRARLIAERGQVEPPKHGSAYFPFLRSDGWVVRRVRWTGANVTGFEDSQPMMKWQVIDEIDRLVSKVVGL